MYLGTVAFICNGELRIIHDQEELKHGKYFGFLQSYGWMGDEYTILNPSNAEKEKILKLAGFNEEESAISEGDEWNSEEGDADVN